LQLLIGDTSANREREISSISLSLKALAKELSIPVVAMAQLNRNALYRGSKPRLSDLRESGAIENDADVVILLHRPNVERDIREDCEVASLIVAKQKDGPTGEIDVLFHKKYLRFDNYSEEEELVQGFDT
jgi:replicative DNA helicase